MAGKTNDVLDDEYLTPAEVAAKFRVSKQSLQKWRTAGTGGPDFTRVGPRSIRYPRKGVELWIKSRTDDSAQSA